MIDHIDHVVLTTRDLASCLRFYSEILGMKLEKFQTPTETRIALKFGTQKINVHEWGREFTPRAHVAAPGTLDLCFIASVPLDEVVSNLKKHNVNIIEGPGIQLHFQNDKDWHYRKEERQWVSLHVESCWYRCVMKNGRMRQTRLYMS